MPALKNPKHELFATALAKGKTQVEAQVAAGYKLDAPNAQRLTRNDNIQRRVRELQNRVADRTEETVERVTRDLREVFTEARNRMPELGAGAMNAATNALMGIAKINGLIVDKVQGEMLVIPKPSPAMVKTVDLSPEEWIDLWGSEDGGSDSAQTLMPNGNSSVSNSHSDQGNGRWSNGPRNR